MWCMDWDAPELAVLPDLTACASLRHVMVSHVQFHDSSALLHLAASRLPAKRIRLTVRNDTAQVFVQLGLDACMDMDLIDCAAFTRVLDLAWGPNLWV